MCSKTRHTGIMSHDQHRSTGLCRSDSNCITAAPAGGIEITRRFIRQDQAGIIHQGAVESLRVRG